MFYVSSAPSQAPDSVTAYNTSSIMYNPADLESDFKLVSVNYTTNTATLTDLDVHTKYAINVSAVSSGGVGPAKSTFASTGANTILFLSYLLPAHSVFK